MIELRPTTIVVLAVGIALSWVVCAPDPAESPLPPSASITDIVPAVGHTLAASDGYVTTGFEEQFP